MCQIIESYKESKTFTGYKYALKTEDGKYISPATGIEYKVGKIEIPKYSRSKISKENETKNRDTQFVFRNDIICKKGNAYIKDMVGYTGLFTDSEGPELLKQKYDNSYSKNKPIILKMAVKNKLKRGEYTIIKELKPLDFITFNIILGKAIVSIEEIN